MSCPNSVAIRPKNGRNSNVTGTKPRLNLGATWGFDSGCMFDAQDDFSDFESAHRAEAAQLDRRIVLVATVVMAELWALTSAIEAWAEGANLTIFLAFQAAAFVLALAFWKAPVPRPVPVSQADLASRGPLAQETAAG